MRNEEKKLNFSHVLAGVMKFFEEFAAKLYPKTGSAWLQINFLRISTSDG